MLQGEINSHLGYENNDKSEKLICPKMHCTLSVNSSFRKVTKKGAFPNENALFKLLYLRVTELYKKWDDSTIQNWSMVRNQLDAHPQFQDRFRNYCN